MTAMEFENISKKIFFRALPRQAEAGPSLYKFSEFLAPVKKNTAMIMGV